MALDIWAMKKTFLTILFLLFIGPSYAATLSVAMTQPVRPGPISQVMRGGLSGLIAPWVAGDSISAVDPYINSSGILIWSGAFLNPDGTTFPTATGYEIDCGPVSKTYAQTYIVTAPMASGYGYCSIKKTGFVDGDSFCIVSALSNTLKSAPSNEVYFKLVVYGPATPSNLK